MQMVKAGTRTQTLLSFSHVKKVLEAVISSLTLAHVIQAHCYTTRHQDIPIIRAIWESMLMAAVEEKVSQCGLEFCLRITYQCVKRKAMSGCFIIDAEEILIMLTL